jgi:aryl-phospho-beta-D-glucosidase BglC (GH1 family)
VSDESGGENWKMRKLCAILISFVFFISLVDMHPAAAEDIDGISGSDVCNEDFSASEIVNGIIAGFDLGNELDCYNKVYNSSSSVSSAETWWGNPKISQEMIDTIHEEGFNAIRIPVTWYNFTSPIHMKFVRTGLRECRK